MSDLDTSAAGVAESSESAPETTKESKVRASTPASAPYRNDPRHTTPYALPVECLDLTPQQVRFCEAYLTMSNATQAALSVGYAEASAASQASDLLKNAKIEAYMRARISQQIQALAISREFIEAELLDTYAKAKEPIPIYDMEGNFTGEYKFDGRTAVAALGLLAKMRNFTEKPDGRSKQAFNIAITIGKYNREAQAAICDAAGIPVPPPDAVPRVPGFPRIEVGHKRVKTINENGEVEE